MFQAAGGRSARGGAPGQAGGGGSVRGGGRRAFTGTVKARVESDLGFRVPGKVVERLVDAGVAVKAGQPLMRLDRADYAHSIADEEGTVAAAAARNVNAQADLKRCAELLPADAVSRKEYDAAGAEADSAKSLLEAALARLQIARDNDSYTELRADSDGVVMETLAEPGQVVTAGQVVVKLAHAGPREAAVNLPETVRPVLGEKARASLYGNASLLCGAFLRQLSDSADPLTRTYEARYVLEGEAALAPLGATVTVYIAEDGKPGAVQVPLAALYDAGEGPGVWVWNPKTSQVSFQRVQVAALGSEEALLAQGPPIGARIVALGANLLHEGDTVRVAEGGKVQVAMNEGARR